MKKIRVCSFKKLSSEEHEVETEYKEYKEKQEYKEEKYLKIRAQIRART